MATTLHIPYIETGFFTKLVTDYLSNDEKLKPFYATQLTITSIEASIKSRENFKHRDVLVNALQEQYIGLSLNEKVKNNIELLSRQNTYTVTTAHQPNIFTGPLYFIYKILHTVKLAETLQQQLPAYNFVPVYYMGSEDADIDELNNITIDGKKYVWNTNQTGAVGRMKVDKALLNLIAEMQQQIGVEEYGNEFIGLLNDCYTNGVAIQEATLKLVNTLFGSYGVVIIDPDNAKLKSLFNNVIEKELTEQFSHIAVEATIAELQKNYKVQAGGRNLNLFYLIDDKRERIELINDRYIINNLGTVFSKKEILKELNIHPERFSANVILRPLFQETILPNVAFIGGGGELAYWLELKKVFKVASVPYPALVLRNSFLIITNKQQQAINRLNITAKDLFKDEHTLIKNYVVSASNKKLRLAEEAETLSSFYDKLEATASEIDRSLKQHIQNLKAKAAKQLSAVENKMYRAEIRKHEAAKRNIENLKATLFPNNSLHERVENLAGFYATYGKGVIETIYKNSLALEQEFTIINYSNQ